MKLLITHEEWNELAPAEQRQIAIWKKRKGYLTETLCLCQAIEYLTAVSHNLHKEESDGRFFNNILINNESSIGWDGQELIDIIWYEILQNIRQRLAQRTITEETAS